MRQPLTVDWQRTKPLIGMVHLLPLPGAPGWAGSLQEVLDRAAGDAEALVAGGMDGLIVENFADVPFYPTRVPPVTIAAMTTITLRLRAMTGLPVGVNVLRNDAGAALAICAATGASFVRVNVHTGAMLTDQGWVEGVAHESLRLRAQLELRAAIFADVFVKHATPPAGATIGEAARDTWERGCADALIVSGSGTGVATRGADIEQVRAAVPDSFILVGSGMTADNAAALLRLADGAIVGSALKADGSATSPVSLEKVRRLVDAAAASR